MEKFALSEACTGLLEENMYPSASATYLNSGQTISLIDSYFFDIIDDLAQDQCDSLLNSDPVAFPVDCDCVSLKSSPELNSYFNTCISAKTVHCKVDKNCIDSSSQISVRFRKVDVKLRAGKRIKLKRKNGQNSDSARSQATAKRERVKGKFKQIQTKWISATDFFSK
jgi:hypothetical protein